MSFLCHWWCWYPLSSSVPKCIKPFIRRIFNIKKFSWYIPYLRCFLASQGNKKGKKTLIALDSHLNTFLHIMTMDFGTLVKNLAMTTFPGYGIEKPCSVFILATDCWFKTREKQWTCTCVNEEFTDGIRLESVHHSLRTLCQCMYIHATHLTSV